jgi:hypothetical protein
MGHQRNHYNAQGITAKRHGPSLRSALRLSREIGKKDYSAAP